MCGYHQPLRHHHRWIDGDDGEQLIAGVREVIYAGCAPLATKNLSIVQSITGKKAGIIGASRLALEHGLSSEAHTSRIKVP